MKAATGLLRLALGLALFVLAVSLCSSVYFLIKVIISVSALFASLIISSTSGTAEILTWT